jgi:hypothetical protein
MPIDLFIFAEVNILIATADKGKATEISYSEARSLVTFLRGFILRQQGICFYVWLWYKRERTSKHSAIWLILGGYAPSYKSDSLVFRCSFYALSLYCIILHNVYCTHPLDWPGGKCQTDWHATVVVCFQLDNV